MLSPSSSVPSPAYWATIAGMARGRPIRQNAAPPYPNRVAELRAAAGLTQEEAGERSGLAAKSFSKLERGLVQLHAGHLKRVSEALGVHPMELFLDGPRLSKQQRELVRLMEGLPPEEQDRLVRVIRDVLNFARSAA